MDVHGATRMQGKSWYFSRKGRVEGPFTEAQLRQRVEPFEGYLVWNPSLAQWKTVEEVFGDALEPQQSLAANQTAPANKTSVQSQTHNVSQLPTKGRPRSVPVNQVSEQAVAQAVKQLAQKWLALEKAQARQRVSLLMSVIEEQDKILAGQQESLPSAAVKTQQAIRQLQSEIAKNQRKVSVINRADSNAAQQAKLQVMEAVSKQAPTNEAARKVEAATRTARPTATTENTKPVEQNRNIQALDAEIESTRTKVEKLQNSLKKVTSAPVVKQPESDSSEEEREMMLRRVVRRRRRRAR